MADRDKRIERAFSKPEARKLHREYKVQLIDTLEALRQLFKEVGLDITAVTLVGAISTDAYDLIKIIKEDN